MATFKKGDFEGHVPVSTGPSGGKAVEVADQDCLSERDQFVIIGYAWAGQDWRFESPPNRSEEALLRARKLGQ